MTLKLPAEKLGLAEQALNGIDDNFRFNLILLRKLYPCIPQFNCIKVGFKGVYISRTSFPDVESEYGSGQCFSILLLAATAPYVFHDRGAYDEGSR